MKNFLKNLGPGVLVSAAFIGPGTVTICSIAGVDFGFSLLWALGISIVACIILQEMAARIGLVTGEGLSVVIRKEIPVRLLRNLMIILILSAIVIGNAAYEAGNITGAVLGLDAIYDFPDLSIGNIHFDPWSVFIGLLAFFLLYIGNYKTMERVFIGLVAIMSISFIVVAIMVQPSFAAIIEGFRPSVSSENILTITALVGTTIVPYNLFLHASLVSEKWNGVRDLGIVRKDLIFAIGIGGVVSMAILICGASSGILNVESAADLAAGLEPLFGKFATYFLGMGLLAAGITSSVTAPLAAAYVAKECFGWEGGLKSFKFRLVWATILILGIFLSSIGLRPVEVIKFAQVANGIVLPAIAIFLIWAVNRDRLMKHKKNSLLQNILGILVILLTIILGMKSIINVIGNL